MRLKAPLEAAGEAPVDYFARRETLSRYWHNCASDLHGSAAAIWISSTDRNVENIVIERTGLSEGFDLGIATPMVFRMLSGMSLELLLKAILIRQNKTFPTKGHDLLKLVERAAMSYTTREAGLLDLLAHAITWQGRYPVPKKRAEWERMLSLSQAHLWEPVERDGKKTGFARSTGALNWAGYERLWTKTMVFYHGVKDEPVKGG